MKISRENLLGGLIIIALGIILLTQAYAFESLNTDEGTHPMDYPKVLIWVFIALGLLIIISPARKSSDSDLPLFSLRTATVAGILVLYALLLDVVGFGVTSFVAACAVGYTMGWHNWKSLVLSNLAGVGSIWLLFNYVLSIALPRGFLL